MSNKIKVRLSHLLVAETDVEGKNATFQSALLRLAQYPLQNSERCQLFALKKRIEKILKNYEEFRSGEADRLGATKLPNGSATFNKPEDVVEFQAVMEVKEAEMVELPLSHRLNVAGISDGSFEVPKNAKINHPLTFSDVSRLSPILALPEDILCELTDDEDKDSEEPEEPTA